MIIKSYVQLHNFRISNNTIDKLPLVDVPDSPENSQVEEQKDSLAIFFILLVLVLSIFLVHLLILTEFHFMPESLAIVLLGLTFYFGILFWKKYITGATIGLILSYTKWDWREVETFNPNIFFLVLLPVSLFYYCKNVILNCIIYSQLSLKVDIIFTKEISLQILFQFLHMLLLELQFLHA